LIQKDSYRAEHDGDDDTTPLPMESDRSEEEDATEEIKKKYGAFDVLKQ
jgi:hypothetical protein